MKRLPNFDSAKSRNCNTLGINHSSRAGLLPALFCSSCSKTVFFLGITNHTATNHSLYKTWSHTFTVHLWSRSIHVQENQNEKMENDSRFWVSHIRRIFPRMLLDPGHSLFLCSYHCKIPSLHCLLFIEQVVDGKHHAKAYGDELRLGQTGTLHKVESIPKTVARNHVALNCVDKHFFLHELWEEFLSASLHSNFPLKFSASVPPKDNSIPHRIPAETSARCSLLAS